MPKLELVVADTETFWSTEHSLTKMSPITYITHPETEVISVAVKFGNHPTDVIFGEDNIRQALRKIDWSNKILVFHNAEGFDAPLWAWRFGIKPAMWLCTLAMARPIHAKQAGGSLKKLVEHYSEQLKAMGISGVKDSTALINTKGRHLKDFTPAEIDAMREYNKDDTEQCAGLFKILAKDTPASELRLIDLTIRMLVEPQFEIDRQLLVDALKIEQENKRAALAKIVAHFSNEQWEALGLDAENANEEVRALLASSAKFAAFLTSQGVDVPMKLSKTTGKPTSALAKTDQEFLDLQEHDNELVAAAARARLGVKSTMLETRIDAFLKASDAVGGRLPVPLKYYGADTTGRWSGWAYNPQNLPRMSGKNSDALRNSLRAPAGYKVIVADLSGIELRVNMFLWQVPYAMALFQASPDKADLYRHFAANELYTIPEDEVSKAQRQVGKVSHLGLGFGSGAATFQKVARNLGGVILAPDESSMIVRTYRAAHPDIVAGWKTCHTALDQILTGRYGAEVDPWGLCTVVDGGIKTPRGMIRYPGLRRERNDEGKLEFFYGEGRHKARIYGPKVDENIVQHLARCIIADNMLEVANSKLMRKYPPALTVHDELVYVVPEAMAEESLDYVQSVMRTPPAWWPELVVWSEGSTADTYGQAK